MNEPTARSAPRSAAGSPPVRIQILHVPDCPLLEGARSLVSRCVAQSAADVIVEEIEGPYLSPTLLVNGTDTTGRPIVATPSCRLDLPTEEQILAALAQEHASTPTLHHKDGPEDQCAWTPELPAFLRHDRARARAAPHSEQAGRASPAVQAPLPSDIQWQPKPKRMTERAAR